MNPLRVEVFSDYLPQTHEHLEKDLGLPIDFLKVNGVNGGDAAWIVIASITPKILEHVLPFLIGLERQHRIKKIVYGDLQIENPDNSFCDLIRKKIEKDWDLQAETRVPNDQ